MDNRATTDRTPAPNSRLEKLPFLSIDFIGIFIK
jgi:hypothetical protein